MNGWSPASEVFGIFGRAVWGEPGDATSKYRFRLERAERGFLVSRNGRTINFLMLNPSTATADVDDPTIAKCWRYAVSWGFRHLIITNLYAFRATDPKKMLAALNEGATNAIGPGNDQEIWWAAKEAELTVMAWGQNAEKARAEYVRATLSEGNVKLAYLRWGKSREPHHPLYLPGHLSPTTWIRP